MDITAKKVNVEKVECHEGVEDAEDVEDAKAVKANEGDRQSNDQTEVETAIEIQQCDEFDERLNNCDFASLPESPAVIETQPPVSLNLLSPDHPLLAKFQQSLREYLLRTKEQLSNEIDDMRYNIKLKEQQREDAGAKLYDMQQELRHQSQQLEEYSLAIQANVQARHREEACASRVRHDYEEYLAANKELKTLYNRRMVELEHTARLERQLRQWTLDMEDEVKNAKRAVSRDAQLQKQLSEDKRRSDLLFLHLDEEVKQRENELVTVSSELNEVREVIKLLNHSIYTANTDLEVLQQEHKRLTQAWSEVIVAISHRDKILYQVQEAVDNEKETIKLCTFGIEAIRKQIAKALDENQKLETFKARLSNDFSVLKQQCIKEAETLTALEQKLEAIPTMLERTEKDLQEAKIEGNSLANEIRRLQFKLDKQNGKKYKIEEQILKLAQDQLITDKASQYRLKLLNEAQEQRRGMELTLAQSQNQLAETLLELEHLKGLLIKLRDDNASEQAKLTNVEKQSDQLLAELKHLETQIEVKMKRIDRLSGQLEELLRATEGAEVSPTEIKIKGLEKVLQATELQIREHYQFWLMLQNHFVNLSQKRNQQLNEIQITRKQFSIIKQKSLKVDADLEESEKKLRELSRQIQLYTCKLELLNDKMFKKRNQHENEESECEMEHSLLLERLKDHELAVLAVEAEIDQLQTDIEHHKDLVLDKHRESLSWETKFKLIEETLRWRKQEHTLESEIGTMKTEIHRMQIRYAQLRRAQEKLVQDLEHCVMHREQIFVTAVTKQRLESKTKRSKAATTIQQKIMDMRNKLKLIQSDISVLTDKQIVEVQQEQERIYVEVKQLRAALERETTQDALIRNETEESLLLKHLNLESIVRKQNRAKAYRRLASSSNVLPPKLPRSESALELKSQKQNEINDNLNDLVQSFVTDYPAKKMFFLKISQILKD